MTDSVLNNIPQSTILMRAATILRESIGFKEDYYVKNGYILYDYPAGHGSDLTKEVRPVTDADKVVLAQADELENQAIEAEIKEYEAEISRLKAQADYKQNQVDQLNSRLKRRKAA
tara:strand:+ start:2164 stop:2511 length:348 start_codon:yes stop_codon:yes gene_type:complete